MLKKIQNFLERDQDITYYGEFHYIYITLKETVKILSVNTYEFYKGIIFSFPIKRKV